MEIDEHLKYTLYVVMSTMITFSVSDISEKPKTDLTLTEL